MNITEKMKCGYYDSIEQPDKLTDEECDKQFRLKDTEFWKDMISGLIDTGLSEEQAIDTVKIIYKGYQHGGYELQEIYEAYIAIVKSLEEVKQAENKHIDVWYISASTGCTCCSEMDFNQGFYTNEEEPTKIVELWREGRGNPLRNHLTTDERRKNGSYTVYKEMAEILPDGRVIVDNTVFSAGSIDYPGQIDIG